MQKHVNLVDLVKSFPTNIFLQNLASIQPRTSPIKFAHLADKSEKGSITNFSTKVEIDHLYTSNLSAEADCHCRVVHALQTAAISGDSCACPDGTVGMVTWALSKPYK